MNAQSTTELIPVLESEGRNAAARWESAAEGVSRLELLRAFARGAGWELYFDARGQATLQTGLFLQHSGDVERIAAPCVDHR